ncbi:MAG: NAD(P)/FAD-dependent oxidoreductase [Dehalococcoidia bacterium]|nr:NAD(P)/FAD-dependent oxidoreductase [Dehalococcoidia bacterium]
MIASDVVVLGGGAAGLMCAIEAGRRGRRVVVLERSEHVGKKILISGGGRCNFTNLHTGPDNYLSANPHFCRSALARYTPADFVVLVERHRIAYHEKEQGQLFCDGSARQIVEMLLAECRAAGVEVRTGCGITAAESAGSGFRVSTAHGPVDCARLVVATGGLSIPKMGATDFGYRLARSFGHTIIPTRAGLVPLTFGEPEAGRYRELAGVSLPVEVRCGDGAFSGGMLFTHRGLSGPPVLQISSYWEPGAELSVDFLPGLDPAGWLDGWRKERPDALLSTALAERLPQRLAKRLGEAVFDNRPLRQFRDAELRSVAEALGRWRVRPMGTEGYRTAEVTLGGVNTRELSSTTMESTIVPGLYFIGEVLDVTGHLGGHNFQWAWASGHAAGQVV